MTQLQLGENEMYVNVQLYYIYNNRVSFAEDKIRDNFAS